MDVIRKGFHAVTFLVYSYGLYFDQLKVVIPPDAPLYFMSTHVIGGRWKYLSTLTLILNSVFFGLCVLNDLMGSETVNPTKRSFLQKLRDGLLSTLVAPLCVLAPFIFWSAYAVDSEVTYSASMQSWYPPWLNHINHTLPFFAAIIEIIITNHVYPNGRILYFPIVVVVGLYVAWIYFIFHHTGVWMHNFLKPMDSKIRAVIMASLVLPSMFFVFLGHNLHLAVWGPVKEASYRRRKKDKKH